MTWGLIIICFEAADEKELHMTILWSRIASSYSFEPNLDYSDKYVASLSVFRGHVADLSLSSLVSFTLGYSHHNVMPRHDRLDIAEMLQGQRQSVASL